MIQSNQSDSHDSQFEFDEEVQALPARMLNEFVYCPRLFYLEHVDGLFANNADTIEGTIRHQRVDKKTDELPSGKGATTKKSGLKKKAEEATVERTTIHARSVTLGSQQYGILAKLDLVQSDGERATPVDYKRGSPKQMPDGSLSAWDPERVQLCAQALVLRENGYQCDEGVLFFWETRQRVTIAIDTALVEMTVQAIAGARQVMERRLAPPPLVSSPKCPRCSLVGICLPDETNRLRQLDHEGRALIQRLLFDVGPQWRDSDGNTIHPSSTTRALVTARDERRPLYLNTPGLYVGKSDEVLHIKERDTIIEKIRLNDVSQVNLMGSVQVTTQAIQTLLQLEIPLLYFTMGGWFYGMTQPVGLKNIIWRREQFRQADSAPFCLRLARQLVLDKIRNQRTLLMRNHVHPPVQALRFLKALTLEVEQAVGLEQLLGLEGVAAKTYFEHFAGMIKVGRTEDPNRALWDPDDEVPAWLNFNFLGRNRRPPRDPVNALLSLGYSLLAKDMTVTCASVGLDPYLGYYHQPRFGRPALALDLMEPFRPLIVDSAVLSAINTRMVQPGHFVAAADAVALTAEGRKAFFRAYEQRMDQLVTHPLFGYRVSYRRVMEIQTRLLARMIMGEIWQYPSFVTR